MPFLFQMLKIFARASSQYLVTGFPIFLKYLPGTPRIEVFFCLFLNVVRVFFTIYGKHV